MADSVYLPRLYLPQMADDGIINQNELDGVGNSIAMVLDRYADAAPGDFYEFFFGDETDSFAERLYDPYNPDQSRRYDFPFTVYKDAVNIPDGIYPVYFRVRELSGNYPASPNSEVFLDRNGTLFEYKPPVFPGAVNGVLPEEEYLNQVRVNVTYDSMMAGDDITLTLTGIDENGVPLQGSETQRRPVNEGDVTNNKTVSFTLSNNIPQQINNRGTLKAFYSGTLGGLPDMFSPPAQVSLGSEMMQLAPPVFVDARNGALSIAEVTVQGSSRLKASYTAMAAGDRVTFTVSGKNAANQPVTGANWTSAPVTVQPADITNGRYDVSVGVPASVLLSVGENGKIRAAYEVLRINTPGVSTSLPAEVIMTASATITQGVQISTNSPFREAGSLLRPCNRGVVYAPPGSRVQLDAYDVSTGVQPLLTFVDINGEPIGSPPDTGDSIASFTNTKGRAYFTVHLDGLAYGLCKVRTTIDDTRDGGADRNINFFDNEIAFSRYLLSENNPFISYRSTTQAPADGVVRNTIYVIVSADAQSDVISAEITGSATATLGSPQDSGPPVQNKIYALNADRSVAIDVTDTVANNSQLAVRLSLPRDGDMSMTVSGINGMVFVTPLNP